MAEIETAGSASRQLHDCQRAAVSGDDTGIGRGKEKESPSMQWELSFGRSHL